MDSLFDTGIRPIVDAHLLELSKERRSYGDYWSASSAGYCMRKVIFDRLGLPEVEPDPRKQRVFEAGHIFHSWIQGLTKSAGLSIAQEVELKDEGLHILGHFDDLVLVGDNLILYDYKTAHSKWFEYAKGRPMSHYNRLQLGTYMYMLRNADTGKFALFKEIVKRKGGDINLEEARILKISKDDLRQHEIQLLWTPELEKEVVGYWRTLNGYWEKKQLPRCTCAEFEKNSKTGIGFMADKRYNPYYYDGEPCSVSWFQQHKEVADKWKKS